MRAVVVSLALLVPVAAYAATEPQAEPAPASAAPAATPASLSLDTPIAEIAAAPAGKAVLDKQLPGLLTHPAYETFKAISLKALQPFSNGLITDERLAAVEAGLKAITPAG